MTSDAAPFPLPVPDDDTRAFWDAAAERRLVVPRCAACGWWIWQPKPVCPRCHADAPEWREVPGEGSVVSFTVLHPPVLPAFAPHVPFVVLLVGLDVEGDGPVRMIGQLADRDGTLVRAAEPVAGLDLGARVALTWREQGGVVLPAWYLDRGDALR